MLSRRFAGRYGRVGGFDHVSTHAAAKRSGDGWPFGGMVCGGRYRDVDIGFPSER